MQFSTVWKHYFREGIWFDKCPNFVLYFSENEEQRLWENRMKKLLAVAGLAFFLAQAAMAWRPAGWVYQDYPWAYEGASGDWYWFSTTDQQWICNLSSQRWWSLGNSALRSGWAFFQWPYAYARSNGAWHYINEVDTQWVINMRTEQWSRFGVATP